MLSWRSQWQFSISRTQSTPATSSVAIVWREIMPIPRLAATACFTASLLPSSIAIFISTPRCPSVDSTTLRVAEPASRTMKPSFGAVLSKYVGQDTLIAIFALLALVAAGLMLLPKDEGDDKSIGIELNRLLAILVSVAVGFLGGRVGQGGAFILIPLMLYVLKLPTRITIGSSLGIVLFSAAAGLIAKLGTGQIVLPLALALAVGAVPGARLGGYVSKRVSTRTLRGVLAALIGLTAANMWWGLLVR